MAPVSIVGSHESLLLLISGLISFSIATRMKREVTKKLPGVRKHSNDFQ
jgi:hypothetical protein